MTSGPTSRRAVLTTIAALGSSSLAGCFFASGTNHKNLIVANGHDRSHTVTVAVAADGAPDERTKITLDPGESRRAEDFLYLTDASYTTNLRVDVDGTTVRRVRIWVDFDYDRLRVAVVDTDNVDLQPADEIVSTTRQEDTENYGTSRQGTTTVRQSKT